MRLLDYFKRMYRIHLKWKGMQLAWPSICCSLWRRERCHSGTGSLSSAPSQSTWKIVSTVILYKVYKEAVFFCKTSSHKMAMHTICTVCSKNTHTKLKRPDIVNTLVRHKTCVLVLNQKMSHKSLAVLEMSQRSPNLSQPSPKCSTCQCPHCFSPLLKIFSYLTQKFLTQHFLPVPKTSQQFPTCVG